MQLSTGKWKVETGNPTPTERTWMPHDRVKTHPLPTSHITMAHITLPHPYLASSYLPPCQFPLRTPLTYSRSLSRALSHTHNHHTITKNITKPHRKASSSRYHVPTLRVAKYFPQISRHLTSRSFNYQLPPRIINFAYL